MLGSARPAAAQKPKLTLAEAIARANRVQPSVISANGSIRNAQARMRSASGAYLPNLSLSASRGDNFTEGQTFVEGHRLSPPAATTRSHRHHA